MNKTEPTPTEPAKPAPAPGPYGYRRSEAYRGTALLTDRDGDVIAEVYGGPGTAMATAALLAQAPVLLHRLEAAVKMLRVVQNEAKIDAPAAYIADAERVIAKAREETRP